MTIHIPAWMLWALGSVVGVVLLGLAAFGILAIATLREQERTMGRWFGW